MARKSHESKDSIINIRISAKEKAEYQKKAARCGTTLTNYILASLEHSNPIFLKVEGSKELAESIYDFREFLNKNADNHNLPTESINAEFSKIVEATNEMLSKSHYLSVGD